MNDFERDVVDRLARMEQKIDDRDQRCNNHAARVEKTETTLYGGIDDKGICEKVRNMQDDNLKISAAASTVTSGVITGILIWLEKHFGGGH